MQTRHGVLGGASWTREKVCEAQMRLVTSRCRRIRAPSSSTQRGKMVLVLLSALLAHAAWQDGDDDILLSAPSRTSLGASSPCKVDGTRAKDPVCSSWFLTRSRMQIQAKEEQLVESLLMKQIPDRTKQFLLPFGAGLADRLRGHVIGPSFEPAAALRQWVAGTSC